MTREVLPSQSLSAAADGPVVAATLVALLPGALVLGLALAVGGFFPDTVAAAVLVLLCAVVGLALTKVAVAGGASRALAAVLLAAAGLAAWTLLSIRWSHAPARALLEYDRVLLYGLALALFGLLRRTEARSRLLVIGLAAAATTVTLGGLATWMLPDLFPTGLGYNRERLAWPLGYWNAQGLMAGLGVIWNLQIAGSAGDRRLRAAASAAVPLLAAALLLTASRGAVAATLLGLAVFALAGRQRALPAALAATGPPTAIALWIASADDGLQIGTEGASEPGAFAALAACAAMAAFLRIVLRPLDARVQALRVPTPSRSARALAAVAAIGLLVAGFLAADGTERARSAYDRFVNTPTVATGLAPGERLSELSNNGRIDLWRAGIRGGFEPRPLTGGGAGTYPLQWLELRSDPTDALNAHSLYVEQLAELGVVGAVLLFLLLGGIVVALAWRSRGPGRAPWAALLGGAAAWLVHVAVEWDWELPAVTVWLFAAGGLALARGDRPAKPLASGPAGRAALIAACCALAVVPIQVLSSQRQLQRAFTALVRNDCTVVLDATDAASRWMSVRPEAHEFATYCTGLTERRGAALAEAAEARRHDPDAWLPLYYEALARRASGLDPKPPLVAARRRNPRQPVLSLVLGELERSGESSRIVDYAGAAIPVPVDFCGLPMVAVRGPCGWPISRSD